MIQLLKLTSQERVDQVIKIAETLTPKVYIGELYKQKLADSIRNIHIHLLKIKKNKNLL